jgi:tripartite-type tricarboxylate transporter receptor subunit TctC
MIRQPFNRRQFCAGLVCASLGAALLPAVPALAQAWPDRSGQAQAWPDKSVNLILSQPPGSGPDNIARLLADRLGREWGKVVVVLNKPGGQNLIGAQAAARSAPDGYTFYFATTAALVSNVYLFKQLPYDPVKDFEPVAFVAISPLGIMVPGTSPFRSIGELIAASRAAPEKVTLANEGPRTLTGITARWFDAQAAIRNNLVPYTSASVGIQDALVGRVDAIVVDLAATTQYIKHGDLRLLATTSAGRLKDWETTPALSETLKGFDMPGWFVVVAPAGTPKAIVARVNKDINAALADPELAGKIAAIGPIVDPGKSPEQTAAFLQAEHERWSVIAKDINLLPE